MPPIKTILAQDFPASVQSWVGQALLYPLNLILNAIYSGMNNGFTFGENMLAAVNSVSIPVAASAYYQSPQNFASAGPASVISWQWKFGTRPVGVYLVQISDTSSTPIPIQNAVTIDWSYNAGTVILNNITGLNASKSYSATFITIGG